MLDQLAKGLGDAFERAEAARQLLYGFAEHAVETTYLGSSTGLRRRGVQPTGRLELNAKTADRAASAWLGRTTRDFLDVDVAEAAEELNTRLGLGATKIELPAGTLRDSAAARRYRRLDDLCVLDGQCPRRGGGSQRLRRRRRCDQDRAAARQKLPITVRSDPQYPGLETIPFVDFTSSLDDTSWAFDGGLPITATTWIDSGVLHELIRNRGHAARTGARADSSTDNLIMNGGGTASLPGDDREHRARAAADLPVVHPRGRSGATAADRD